MTPQIAVDAERLTVDWALTVDEITDILGDRIYTVVPDNAEWPLMRIIRIGGDPTSRLARLDNPVLQIDVWGGPKATAYAAIATTLAHMAANLPGSHELGAVTAVEVGGPSWVPDSSYSPARPRYTADVRLWTHP